MKIWKVSTIVFASLFLVLLYFFISKNYENNLRKDFLSFSNKNINDLKKEEYDRKNEYLVFDAKLNNKKIDTISYNEAKKQYDDLQAAISAIEKQSELENYSCTEDNFISKFNEMMAFNYPYEKYNENSIKTNIIESCTMRVNVTTTEPKYGWKTFWIFEISFDASDSKFRMKTIKRDFLG